MFTFGFAAESLFRNMTVLVEKNQILLEKIRIKLEQKKK